MASCMDQTEQPKMSASQRTFRSGMQLQRSQEEVGNTAYQQHWNRINLGKYVHADPKKQASKANRNIILPKAVKTRQRGSSLRIPLTSRRELAKAFVGRFPTPRFHSPTADAVQTPTCFAILPHPKRLPRGSRYLPYLHMRGRSLCIHDGSVTSPSICHQAPVSTPRHTNSNVTRGPRFRAKGKESFSQVRFH